MSKVRILSSKVVTFKGLFSNEWDEHREEFKPFPIERCKFYSECASNFKAAVLALRTDSPQFNFHFQSIFKTEDEIHADYRLNLAYRYNPHLNDSSAWFGCSFIVDLSKGFLTRYGVTFEQVEATMNQHGFEIPEKARSFGKRSGLWCFNLKQDENAKKAAILQFYT